MTAAAAAEKNSKVFSKKDLTLSSGCDIIIKRPEEQDATDLENRTTLRSEKDPCQENVNSFSDEI